MEHVLCLVGGRTEMKKEHRFTYSHKLPIRAVTNVLYRYLELRHKTTYS